MNEHIARAIEICGTQEKLAAEIGASQRMVSYWLTSAKKIPAEICKPIQKATRGKVKASDLRPDIFSAKRRN